MGEDPSVSAILAAGAVEAVSGLRSERSAASNGGLRPGARPPPIDKENPRSAAPSAASRSYGLAAFASARDARQVRGSGPPIADVEREPLEAPRSDLVGEEQVTEQHHSSAATRPVSPSELPSGRGLDRSDGPPRAQSALAHPTASTGASLQESSEGRSSTARRRPRKRRSRNHPRSEQALVQTPHRHSRPSPQASPSAQRLKKWVSLPVVGRVSPPRQAPSARVTSKQH